MRGSPVELERVDPARIELWSNEPPATAEVAGGDWDLRAVPFEETEIFRGLHERFVLGRGWEETDFWRRVLARVEAGRPLYGCRTADDLRDHFAYVDDLHGWISEYGYLTARELGPPHDPDDEITVGIGRDGRYIAFTTDTIGGRHRLAIARILGVPEVPVRVLVRHEEWVRSHG